VDWALVEEYNGDRRVEISKKLLFDYIKDTEVTAETAIKGFAPGMKLDKTYYYGISTFLEGKKETLFNRVLWGCPISLV